jgi:2,3-bisphosphoglycerate-independent phosphoglycerate mutase
LKKYDLVYVHVEAPDEAGHSGDYRLKIKAIEDFDSRLVGTILDGLQRIKDYKILLLPDHATPVSIRTHSAEPVPFVIYTNNNEKNRKRKFSERISRMKDARFFDKGYKLMDYFINRGQG